MKYDNKGKHLVFCDKCREDVDYRVEERLLEATLKGERYHYHGKVAYCADCGEEIYVPEINDENLNALYDCYRAKNGIVPLDVIRQIPKKYAIGKRPLSLLLGWGEQTFSRYCEGNLPTRQYSEILQRIYNDPAYYRALLEENQDRLKKHVAYEKSKKAVDALYEAQTEYSKIEQAAFYLIEKCGDISPLALQKALYYIQGFCYAFYQQFCFLEDCEAWVHGPVYRTIYRRYADYNFAPIPTSKTVALPVFSDTETAVIESVIKNICCYSGRTLEQFTHTESPWLETRKNLPSNLTSDRIIPKETIGAYFVRVKEKFDMLSPADIKSYAQMQFEQL